MKRVERYRSRSGPGHYRYNGGRTVTKAGYVLILKPDHPKCRANNYVLEHILVMESFLGRYLLPGERIHHKNGIRDDNRIENLELWVQSQPYGQRVSDLVPWAEEILRRYKGVYMEAMFTPESSPFPAGDE